MLHRDYISPRQLAAAIGVSESSLKRWTDQGVLPVSKTVGGHRRLPFAAVVHFLRTSKTPLVNPEILDLGCPLLPGRIEIAAAGLAFREVLCRGDRRGCVAIAVRCFLSGYSVANVCDLLMRPALKSIGEGWERGEIEVYQEHRAVQVCRCVLSELRRFLRDPPPDAWNAVGAAPSKDPYLLATAMAELVLTELGWHAIDLGPDTPLESLCQAALTENARLVWLSLTARPSRLQSVDELASLAHECSARGIRLVVGGQAVNPGLRRSVAGIAWAGEMGDLTSISNGSLACCITSDAADVIGL